MNVNAAPAVDHAFFDRARALLSLELPESARLALFAPAVDSVTAGASVRMPRPAAVLVPVVAREEPTVLLTQRTSHLSSHAGQIAFPGGKIDATDNGPLGAALREAEEEIGLSAEAVEPLGFLDLFSTGTGYRIAPVVARVRPDFTVTPNEGEVADVFEVPLHFLMSRANHQLHYREWNGVRRRFYAMPYQDRFIWGVTAAILRGMAERLYGE